MPRLAWRVIEAWRKKAHEMTEAKKFDEAIRFMVSAHSRAAEGRVFAPEDLEKPEHEQRLVEFNEELLAVLQTEIYRLRQKKEWTLRRSFEEWREYIMKLVHAAKWEEVKTEARKGAKRWEQTDPDLARRAWEFLKDIELWERNWRKKHERDRLERAKREIGSGSWVDMILGEDDFRANWRRGGWVERDDDGGKGTVRLSAAASSVLSTFRNTSRWLDYEVQFEIQSTAATAIGVRTHRRSRELIGRKMPKFPDWSTVHVKVEGKDLAFKVNGDTLDPQTCSIQGGGIVIRQLDEGYVKIRNLRIRIQRLR
ncbi:MAG: hypothetical protein ACYS47_16245 [Planctomycetota bacterium]